jgi:hypothetical protein
MEESLVPVVTGRACDGCTLCCKMLSITELRKPMGEWCPHAVRGEGCSTYENRPQSCRDFHCLWLSTAEMPDYWRPDRCNMVVAGEATGTVISIIVDPGHEESWTKDPYHRDINIWARQGRWRVQVLTVGQGWVIFPEQDLFLGERKVDDQIAAFGYKSDGLTRQPTVTVRHGDGSLTEVVGSRFPIL